MMMESNVVSKEFVQQLIKKKDLIETDIKELQDVLYSQQKNVGLHEPLVDDEGYPRNDVDVYAVRNARNRIICLQNDHKDLMKEIERSIHELHAEERRKNIIGGEGAIESGSKDGQETRRGKGPPFARVDLVVPGSPAKDAGLQVGDLILEFGSVNSKNFTSLKNIADVVQHSLGKPTSITVLRGGAEVHLGLVQKHWSGKGLIGCKIVPIET